MKPLGPQLTRLNEMTLVGFHSVIRAAQREGKGGQPAAHTMYTGYRPAPPFRIVRYEACFKLGTSLSRYSVQNTDSIQTETAPSCDQVAAGFGSSDLEPPRIGRSNSLDVH